MTIKFRPDGQLDISTDPAALPQQVQNGTVFSNALTRCKNLRRNQSGQIITRDGSVKLNTTALVSGIPNLLIEQQGDFYTFAGASIHRNEAQIKSGLTEAQWSGFKYNSFNSSVKQIFVLNGTDRKRVFGNSVVEWGIDEPVNAATLAVGGSTGLTGDYLVKYTYVRKEGTVIVSESNSSPASSSQTLSNESLSVTVTASTDSEVTHIRVYRTVAGGGVYLVDQDITVPAVTVDSTTTDANLGVEVETDHNRPPSTGTVAFGPLFNGISFIIDGPNLHYCIAKKAEYWPTNHFVEVSNLQFPGIAGVLWNGQPYVLTKNDIFFIQGSSHGSFFPLKMKAKTGAQGIFGAVAVQGQGIFHTGVDGIYLFANGRDTKITEPRLEPIFRKAKTGETTTIGTLPRVGRIDNAILHQFLNLLLFAYSSTETGNPDNVVVLNLDTQRITHHVYNDGSDIKITAMHTDVTNQRLLVADDTGFVRHIEKNDAADDSGTAISFDVQSMDFTLQTRKHFPRWAKYDVDVSVSGASVTGELYLDGILHQSHTITGNRKTRRRLVETGNGNRQSHRIHGSGQVTIFAVESE